MQRRTNAETGLSGSSAGRFYLKINSVYLEKYLTKHDLRLGYVMKTIHYLKKERYEEAKTVKNYELLNVGKIII